MKANILNRIPKILVFAFLFFSCSSDLDFDQANDLKLEPVFVANLAYFSVPATQLVNDGSPQVISDVQGFDAFKDEFFRDNLVKTEFDFEIDNTIVRAFRIEMQLLDANDQVLETNPYSVPAYSGGSNVIKFPTEVYENERLELLKQTVKLKFIIEMQSGSPLDENSVGNLKFRSSANVYMVIE